MRPLNGPDHLTAPTRVRPVRLSPVYSPNRQMRNPGFEIFGPISHQAAELEEGRSTSWPVETGVSAQLAGEITGEIGYKVAAEKVLETDEITVLNVGTPVRLLYVPSPPTGPPDCFPAASTCRTLLIFVENR
jgi:hypothetical protein